MVNQGAAMERMAWTARGSMAPADRQVIEAVANKNKAAARIFITGEVHESYVGEAAVRMLSSINDVFYERGAGQEPLFIETRQDTVRMARFEPRFVWGSFHPDLLVSLFEDESDRLGLGMDPWDMEGFDFYESMIDFIKELHGPMKIPVVPPGGGLDEFYNAVYLSCLLLFGKPNYMDVPVAQHFADPVVAALMRKMKYRSISKAEQEGIAKLQKEYSGIVALTNPEMSAILSLYEA